MALDALTLRERALYQQRNFARKERRRTRLQLQFAAEIPLMLRQTLCQRDLQAVQVEIGVRRRRVAAAVPQVDLFLGIQREKVDGVVPVAVEQADIGGVHARDADAHVLTQELAQRRILR